MTIKPQFSDTTRPVVCVQGLGFAGSAMAVAVASARDASNRPHFNVIGVDLPVPGGLAAISSINDGRFPFATTDEKLRKSTRMAHENGNLVSTCDEAAYGMADVILCDVNLDLFPGAPEPRVRLEGFESAIRTVGRNMRPGALVIVETTVPPGTCSRVAAPILAAELDRRGAGREGFLLAHSFERVMPGADYLDSIVNLWRVFAGHTAEAAAACRAFLDQVLNTRDFPLTELATTTASETAKVMENSYRAVNIAFIEEWARFAEAIGVDLFEVIAAIRQRPTHSNIRQPGFGVGGYCLTKDPLFAGVAARHFFGRDDLEFPFSERAVAVNAAMPLVSLERLRTLLGGLDGKRIAIFGVSYRPDVGDTRSSPSETFARAAIDAGAFIVAHDPLVTHWEEMAMTLDAAAPCGASVDAAIFAVPHQEYRRMDMSAWASGAAPVVLDANSVLSPRQRADLRGAGCRVEAVGVGLAP